MTAYYNEFDPFAAAWLRELIADGLIAPGDVDERSIADVQPDDLVGYDQVHFFAGIGGWSRALRLAGWPDTRPVWTGSCPCQPFSAAGKRKGTADERHLWPEMRRLIAHRRPPVVFGEQVASKDGRDWLAGVRADLEALGYAVGAADLCAAGVGAPHIRQRAWWVADAGRSGVRLGQRGSLAGASGEDQIREEERKWVRPDARDDGTACSERLGHADDAGLEGRLGGGGGERAGERAAGPHGPCGPALGMEHAPGDGREQWRAEPGGRGAAGGCGDGGMADAHEGQCGRIADGEGRQRDRTPAGRLEGHGIVEPSGGNDHWSRAVWHPCSDGKARRVEPGIFPLAHGVPNRVGTLRGAGNAIVHQVATEFIAAWLDTRP